MVSLEHWRQAARALIPDPVRSMLPPAGEDVPDSPIATENGRALFNTKIEFIEELPKTVTGKILRRELRATELAKLQK
jgi:acyl-CoA synthetase (AMP-forming)/AMP-acid ligase II